jgi:hypothetical protein
MTSSAYMHQESDIKNTIARLNGSRVVLTVTGLNAILGTILLLSGAHHLTQFVLLGEFAGENTQITDQLVAGCNHGILGSDLTVGLNAEQELGIQWMRDLELLLDADTQDGE